MGVFEIFTNFFVAAYFAYLASWPFSRAQLGGKEINGEPDFKITVFFRFIIQYVTPVFLISVFIGGLPGIFHALTEELGTWQIVARILMFSVFAGICFLVYIAYQKGKKEGKFE